MQPETIALHGGYVPDSATKSVAVPIYQTAAYAFDSAEHGAALFNLEVAGHTYTRISNPTTAVLEQRLAAMEGGVAAVALATGAAAITCALLTICDAGSNVVALPHLYGATYTLFAHVLPRLGITVRFAVTDDPSAVAERIDAGTRLVYCESISNPAGTVADLTALAELAHRAGVPLIVDNTIASPVQLRPLDHGADVVVESLTKFVGGHGTTLGGIVVDGGRFPWHAHRDRFAMLSSPEPAYHGVVYTEQFGEAAFAARCRTFALRNTGPALSPFSAFLLLQGLETLPVRIARAAANAQLVAEYLYGHSQVEWVKYPGLPTDPHHLLARRYLRNSFTAIVTFGVAGGFAAGRQFFDALRLFTRLVNLGDSKSLATHPASTTHRQLTPEEMARTGVTPSLIRLSVGIENIEDILADLEQSLARVTPVGDCTTG